MGRAVGQLVISEPQHSSVPHHLLLKLRPFCCSSGLEDGLL